MSNILATGYLSEKIDLIEEAIMKFKKTCIISPTGSGKSSLVYSNDLGFSPLYKLLNKKESNPRHIVFMVLTTNMKIEKDYANYVYINPIYGELDYSDKEIEHILVNAKERVVATNYASLGKLLKITENLQLPYSIVYDECHTLFNKFSFRQLQLEIASLYVSNKSSRLKNTVYLSATMEKSFIPDFKILEFEKPMEKTIPILCQINKLKSNKYQKFLEQEISASIKQDDTSLDNTTELVVVFINNKDDIDNIRTNILKHSNKFHLGINQEDILVLTAKHKHKEYYHRIINSSIQDSSITSNVKILLVTSLIEDSMDIFTDRNIRIIYLVKKEEYFDAIGVKQLCGRFRNTSKINLSIYVPSKNKCTSLSMKDLDELYSAMFNEKLKTEYKRRRLLAEENLKVFEKLQDTVSNPELLETLNRNEQIHPYFEDESAKWFAGQQTFNYIQEKFMDVNNIEVALERQFGDSILISQLDYTLNPDGLQEKFWKGEKDHTKHDNFYYTTEDEEGNQITKEYKGNTSENFETTQQVQLFRSGISTIFLSYLTDESDLNESRGMNESTHASFFNWLEEMIEARTIDPILLQRLVEAPEFESQDEAFIHYMCIGHFWTILNDLIEIKELTQSLPYLKNKLHSLDLYFNDKRIIRKPSDIKRMLKQISNYYIVTKTIEALDQYTESLNSGIGAKISKRAMLKSIRLVCRTCESKIQVEEFILLSNWVNNLKAESKFYTGDDNIEFDSISNVILLKETLNKLNLSIKKNTSALRARLLTSIVDVKKAKVTVENKRINVYQLVKTERNILHVLQKVFPSMKVSDHNGYDKRIDDVLDDLFIKQLGTSNTEEIKKPVPLN